MTTKAKLASTPEISEAVDRADSTQSQPTLRQFVLDFFAYFGSEITADDSRSSVVCLKLDESLAEHFGSPSLRLCFEHADTGPDCELMARGSRLFDMMMKHLRTHSAATLLELPRRHTNSEALMQAVRPRNASILDLRMHETHSRLYVFNWHLTFRSDEKFEELYTVCLNDEGERIALGGEPDAGADAPLLSDLFADAQTESKSNGAGQPSVEAKLPPMTHLVRLADAARKYAVYHADQQSAAHESKILPRLYRTLSRISTYYGQQIEEVYDSHDRDGEKRLVLQQDMERKIAEEVENHRLRVSVELFSYAVFQMPVAVAEMRLSDGVREARAQVTHNRYSGLLERPRCHSCSQETGDLSLDKFGHLICDDCIRQCSSCHEIVCDACGVEPCPVCGEESCADCGESCWACGGRACPEHIDTCPVCGDRVCHACMEVCCSCGVRQCRSHLLTDAVVDEEGDYALVCEGCAVRCPGCEQFSAKLGVCSASGQQFCQNCLVVCSRCGSAVGPGYYETSRKDGQVYCASCLQECPGCGRRTADVVQCAKCGAEFCPECGLTCDICGEHCCDADHQRFAGCDHAICTAHTTHCAVGGESLCPICNRTCGICDLSCCDAHSRRCRNCGQWYCANCIGPFGRCATCENLADGHGEPVDMALEPCTADLEVASMARHYTWHRADNSRFLVYEGRNRTLGKVVVVVDAAQGYASVVDVRRLSLMRRLMDEIDPNV